METRKHTLAAAALILALAVTLFTIASTGAYDYDGAPTIDSVTARLAG